MSTLFKKIIDGELPGKFVWSDDVCVSFMTIGPVQKGHVLVVPRICEPKWTNLPSNIIGKVFTVASIIGNAQEEAFQARRAGLVIAGFEVPHTHLHVIPINAEGDLSLANIHTESDEELIEAAEKLRAVLRANGHGDNVPPSVFSSSLAI